MLDRYNHAGDFLQIRPRVEKVVGSVENASVSPNGDALFEARGEIFLASAAAKCATSPITPAPPNGIPPGLRMRNRSPILEYALHIAPADSARAVRKITLSDHASFYYAPAWSPDGKRIACLDKHLTLWFVELAGGAPVKIDMDDYGGGYRIRKLRSPVWSADSRWIAYTKDQHNHLRALFLYSIDNAKTYQITDGMSDVRYPAFDRSGRNLY